MSDDGSSSGSGSGSGSGEGQALTNLQLFIEKGMLSSESILTEEGVELVNSLNRKEVRQLIKIWKRLGKPEVPQAFFDAFAR